jgi:Xaa-Pro aminopeptidase
MKPSFDFVERMGRARSEMRVAGVDVLLLSLGMDLVYLTGYEAPLTERLTMAVVRVDGPATLVVPALEAPKVVRQPEAFEIRPWAETEDPVAIAADLAGAASQAAIGDQTWAAFLLELQERMASTRFLSARGISRALRLHKADEEVDLLRGAGAAADRVAVRLAGMQLSGRSEAGLAREISTMLIEEGHDMAGFAIVGSGPNGASPHHHPGDRVIETGDAVVIDFGGSFGGYHSDTTRMFYVGEPGPEVAEVHEVVRLAQEAAFLAATIGTPAQDVDRVARQLIEDAGYGEYFIHRTGHGIGLDVHEDPYLVEGNETLLAPGMAFSIEPGIYLPGRFGVRLEDIVVMGSDRPERLNESSRHPVIVG